MIIALTGLAGSGKDTAAEMIAEILGGAAIIALADLPKEMAAKHFDMPKSMFYDRKFKDSTMIIPHEDGYRYTYTGHGDITPRELLVSWWDELFEEHGPDYSLRMNIKKINDIDEKNIIISDIRYPIEFDWIDNEGITLLNIQRDAVEKTIDHVTESGTMKGYAVDNNGSIEDLKVVLTDMFMNPQSFV